MTYASSAPAEPAWAAVWSMSLGIFGIVGAEFLPASLLTSMASDLQVSEGLAGQAVTVTAGVAVLASLLVSVASGRLDRKKVLLFLTMLLVASNLMVALAPNIAGVLIGRVLLGISLGGFWALSAATIMRLVPETHVPKALAILFGGVTAATVFAAPVGSFFGELIGWRVVFHVAAALGAAALVVQALYLPSMYSDRAARLGTLLTVLQRRGIALGMLAFLLVFAGHFSFFTYLRPYLEQVTQAGPGAVTAVLLIFGLGTFAGNTISSQLIARSLSRTQAMMPLMLAVVAVILAAMGGNLVIDTIMAGLWGVAFGIIPVSWSTWVTRVLPDEAESGGGLLVATANLAITIGAGGGGLIFDLQGPQAVFLASAVMLGLAFLTATAVGRMRL